MVVVQPTQQPPRIQSSPAFCDVSREANCALARAVDAPARSSLRFPELTPREGSGTAHFPELPHTNVCTDTDVCVTLIHTHTDKSIQPPHSHLCSHRHVHRHTHSHRHSHMFTCRYTHRHANSHTYSESETVRSLTCVRLFVTPWTAAHQAPLSMGFSRQDTGVGCHALLQGIFSINPGIESGSPALQVDSLPSEPYRDTLIHIHIHTCTHRHNCTHTCTD